MKITVDTNVLVRSAVRDDRRQAAAADRVLKSAEIIAVALPCLCEFVWVLLKVYGLTRQDAATAVRALLTVSTVAPDRPAAEAGLAVLERGGDFADGVNAHQGQALRGQTFVPFDRQAVKRVQAAGLPAQQV